MKILAINGSPRGKESNTNVMVEAFLKGAQSAGAETANIFLADKNIQFCKGCFSCWTETPGQCVIDDDVKEIINMMDGCDVIIFASPLFFVNISGALKTFIDRLTSAGGDPHKASESNKKSPKYMMVSNCGFPDRSQFDVVSLWINRVAALLRTEVAAEIYTASGHILTRTAEEQKKSRQAYLNLLEECGKEIAGTMKLKEETKIKLKKDAAAF